MSLMIRPIEQNDAENCGKIGYEAHKAISSAHGYPSEQPSEEFGIGLIRRLLGNPNSWGVLAEAESLQYEVEPFGIKIILIEPGAIKSNFFNNLKMASKAQRPDSPYTQMMQKLNAGFSFILENAPPPEEVAKVILKAVTYEHTELRYAAGDDARAMLEAKRTMSDAEFGNLMKKQFLSQ